MKKLAVISLVILIFFFFIADRITDYYGVTFRFWFVCVILALVFISSVVLPVSLIKLTSKQIKKKKSGVLAVSGIVCSGLISVICAGVIIYCIIGTFFISPELGVVIIDGKKHVAVESWSFPEIRHYDYINVFVRSKNYYIVWNIDYDTPKPVY